jgi:predicted metal-dependent hydrolase
MLGNLQLHENGASTQFKRLKRQWLVIQSPGNAEEIVNHIRQEVRRVNRTSPIVQEDLRLYQSRFELQRDAQARGREEFIRWYGDRLRPILGTQIAALVKRNGASPRSVQVRELGYRWGSCGYKGDLYFH